MRTTPDRTILSVIPHDGSWVVECDGERFGESVEKAVAKAAANKRARQMLDGGRACQVLVWGETGFFGGRG